MIEDSTLTVAEFLGIVFSSLFLRLVRRANAEDLDMNAYQSTIIRDIVRTYRLVLVSGWVLFMFFVSLQSSLCLINS